jgi:hypothetical protein
MTVAAGFVDPFPIAHPAEPSVTLSGVILTWLPLWGCRLRRCRFSAASVSSIARRVPSGMRFQLLATRLTCRYWIAVPGVGKHMAR